jgi:hypothetical protein
MKTRIEQLSISRSCVVPFVFIAFLNTSCFVYKEVRVRGRNSASNSSNAIQHGDVLRITLKTGETIRKIKVDSINSEKLSGFDWVEKNPGQEEGKPWVKVNKSIKIVEIQSMKKRKFGAGRTVSLVAGSALVISLFALATAPTVTVTNLSFRP